MIEGRLRILAVGDDSGAAEQLVELLSTSGYQIDLAVDGNEGPSRGLSRNDDRPHASGHARQSRTVTRPGRDIELLPREFQVLEYLVCNQGQVVPRAMLLQHVWDPHFDPTTNIIDVYVGRVRRKVDDQQAYPLIHTVRGVGFCARAFR
jgi:DNA-binding response OmpR family regulator